jgi:hypothetical protein
MFYQKCGVRTHNKKQGIHEIPAYINQKKQ